MLKIIKNPDKKVYEQVTKAVEQNDGYCPCELLRTADTKCICTNFKQQQTEGECHCGRYKKIGV